MNHTLRADLHVHTCHSRHSGTLTFLGSRDCYSQPLDVYRVAKARGMDLVCITDHDSIDGGLELMERMPDAADVIVGEEISCLLPEGRVEVHIAAYGMTESLHRDVQRLRGNVFDVTARLREAGVFFALNHLLHFYRGQLPLERYLALLDDVPALETRNGTMLQAHNALCEAMAGGRWRAAGTRLGRIGGSDAHTLRRVGTTWTEAPGRTRETFMASLRAGLGEPGGAHGSTRAVAGDAYGVVGSYIAALIGFGPRDLPVWRRAACLAFAGVSLPMQFMPLAVASARKSAERRAVQRVATTLGLPSTRFHLRAGRDGAEVAQGKRPPVPGSRIPDPGSRSPI